MATIIRMPKMSDTMLEGTIAAWRKQVGDTVKSGDILAEVQTDKAIMELDAYEAGTLLYIAVPVKQVVPIDGILAIIGEAGEDISDLLSATSSPIENDNNLVVAQEPSSSDPPLTTRQDEERDYKVSPLARKMAHERGIDLKSIKGTGDNGRIIKRDIKQPAGLQTPATPPSFSLSETQESYQTVSVSSIRRIIAKKLTESKNEAPHFYLQVSVNMEQLINFRNHVVARHTTEKITFNAIILKATAIALRQHPTINTAWQGDTIRYNHHIHIGVAMASSAGLVVPIIRFADQLSLSQIAAAVKTLQQKAEHNQLQPADLEGATFTVSNLGMLGIETFTAIINPPASCILAVGAIQTIPIVKEGAIVPGSIMQLSLSCDHRVVDGAIGAVFLVALKAYLEEPLRLLI